MRRCVLFAIAFGIAVCAQSLAWANETSANDFAGQILSDATTGRVGIGTTKPAATLDVYKGEIKIGSTGAPCTKELAGALRSAKTNLQFCDGASWRNVSLEKGP